MESASIGMLGVGNMGYPMALRLLEMGLGITVCDLDSEAVGRLCEKGAAKADTPRQLAQRCDLILASMPTLDASRTVALGREGVVHGARLKVYVETSTVGNAGIQEIAQGLRDKGIGFVDAPVSGGPPAARDGTLAVLASGEKAHFSFSRPVLECLAGKLFYLGERPGMSQVAKLINNHISAAGRLAVFEGLAMGMKAGMDLQVLNDVLNAGSARNYTTTDKVPAAILTGTYKFNGPLSIGLKDEALLVDEAQRLGAALWLAPRILDFYRDAAAAGYESEDSMKAFLYIASLPPSGGNDQKIGDSP
ncbi:NAD(P)-dependent oxidoreductase [Pigmentiphaga sp. H8]|uniref:NAD(P)-dependent oxidoreductase n=1 Tax=Pigmentiphaga sp. H8 TaxID=2488560 RepID=UPI001375D0F6|nr:NAD(P)-dependent oxidoreductase [Pigmentiphaga sp. H8]